jgi:hypothetical protein
VKGQNAPFDGEEESQEYLMSAGNYAGPSLVKSLSGLDLIRNPNMALEAVILSFQAGTAKHPERQYPEVAVMDVRYS